MPSYDYKCNACNHEFDEFLRVADRAIPTTQPCPNCQENQVDIVIGAVALGDPIRLGITKISGEFKERLQAIKKKHPRGKINV